MTLHKGSKAAKKVQAEKRLAEGVTVATNCDICEEKGDNSLALMSHDEEHNFLILCPFYVQHLKVPIRASAETLSQSNL